MRNIMILLVLIAAFGLPMLLLADSPMPMMRVVEPVIAQAGDVLTVTGENLGQASVAALYLTDGKKDTKVTIIKESSTSIVFKVPAGVQAGRRALMVLTTGPNPKLIEEPVRVTIQ